MYSDPSGHFLEALAYAFKNWGKNIINVFAEISETIVKEVQDNLFIGAEYGIKGRKVIGDETKPISFFMQNTSDWWKFWEFKYGVKVKIGNFVYSMATGITGTTFSFGLNNLTIDYQVGIDKIGIGASTTIENTTYYYQCYIKTIPTALLLLAILYAPQTLPSLGIFIPGLT